MNNFTETETLYFVGLSNGNVCVSTLGKAKIGFPSFAWKSHAPNAVTIFHGSSKSYPVAMAFRSKEQAELEAGKLAAL